MIWDFQVGDFIINKKYTMIYEVLTHRVEDQLFHAATYEVIRRGMGEDLTESWPKIHMEAHFRKLTRETAKLLYGGTNE